MSKWQSVQDRAGWTTMEHSTKMWIVGFLFFVIIGTIIEWIVKADLNWVYFVVLFIVSFFAA